jgi:hypothetical protein
LSEETFDYINKEIAKRDLYKKATLLLGVMSKLEVVVFLLERLLCIIKNTPIKNRLLVKSSGELEQILAAMGDERVERMLQGIKNQEWEWALDISVYIFTRN